MCDYRIESKKALAGLPLPKVRVYLGPIAHNKLLQVVKSGQARPGHDLYDGRLLPGGSLTRGHYLVPYAQFLYAEMIPNPALETKPDAPPEILLLHFAAADVAVLGSGLTRLEDRIQKYELKFVKSADRRFTATLNTHVAAVTITFTKETA